MRLDELPDDIQIFLLSYLNPLDILRLRKTCWTLHRATSQHVVWVNALRRACIQNSVFMPTFSIKDMSLRELEYAASGPMRWIERVVGASSKEKIALEPLLPCLTQVIDTDIDVVQEIFVVPGGRYFVTTFSYSLVVWDLGAPGATPKRFEAFNVESIFGSELLFVHSTLDGKGLLIFVGVEPSNLELFRIYLGDEENPQLVKIAEARVPALSGTRNLCRWLSGSRFIFMLGPTLNIWDYREHAWASIKVEKDYYELLVSESTMALIYQNHVAFWTIPPLSTSTKPFFDVSTASPIPPLCSVPIALEGSTREPPSWGVPSFWYTGTSQPLIFNIAYELHCVCFECVIGDDLTGTTFTPLYEQRFTGEWLSSASGKFCNDTLMDYGITKDQRLETFIASIPPLRRPHLPKSPDVRCFLHIIDNPREGDYIPFDFCPFSGRVIYVQDDKPGINVLDFLPAPALE